MLSSIFQKKEVQVFLEKISTNPIYYDKKKKNSINYEKFSGLEQPFFIAFDALLKYQIIIEDEEYFLDYLKNLELLWYKIDNFHDISSGICKLLVKFTAKKLGYKNKVADNRKEILYYIYQRYIVDGYFFHAINDIYINDIKNNGFSPQKYSNNYYNLKKIQDKYPIFCQDMDFSHTYVSFTDNFIMACYYSVYSPIYFSNFMCPNKAKKLELNSYAKRDYLGCFNSLHSFLKKREMKDDDIKEIEDVCNSFWKFLKLNQAVPTVMLVKRSYLGKNRILGIDDIIRTSKEDISTVVEYILNYRYANFIWDLDIPSDEISFVCIPYSKYVVGHQEKNVEVIFSVSKFNDDEDGKVSFLLLLGSILILLGCLYSILMFY